MEEAEAEEAPGLEALEETLRRMEDAMRCMRREMDKTDDAVDAVSQGLKAQARMLRCLNNSVHGMQRSHSEFRPLSYYSSDAATTFDPMPSSEGRVGARRAASCGGAWARPAALPPAQPLPHSPPPAGGRVRFALPAAPARTAPCGRSTLARGGEAGRLLSVGDYAHGAYRSLLAAGRARPHAAAALGSAPAARRPLACARASLGACPAGRARRPARPPRPPRPRCPARPRCPPRRAPSSGSCTTTFDLDVTSSQPCLPTTSVSESVSGPASTCSFASSCRTAATTTSSASAPVSQSSTASTVSSGEEAPPWQRAELALTPRGSDERCESAHFTSLSLPKVVAPPSPRDSATNCSVACSSTSSCLPPAARPARPARPARRSAARSSSSEQQQPPFPATAHFAQVQGELRRRLVSAVRTGKTKVVQELLDAGADVNFYLAGRTPLHRAAQRANAGVVSLLLKRGADVAARDCFGRTPLHNAAAQDGCGLCVAILIDAEAELEARNRAGLTPLHYAAEAGNEAAVRALVAAGASAAAADARGRTPLHVAKTLCVHRLLRLGAKQDKENTIIQEEDLKYYPSSSVQVAKPAAQSRKSTGKAAKPAKRGAKSAEQIGKPAEQPGKPKDGAAAARGGSTADIGSSIGRVSKVIEKIDKLVQEVGKHAENFFKSRTDKPTEQPSKNRGHKLTEPLQKNKSAEPLFKSKVDKTADHLLKKKVDKSPGVVGKVRKRKDI